MRSVIFFLFCLLSLGCDDKGSGGDSSASGDDLVCGDGTHEEDGACVPDEAEDLDGDADTGTDTDTDTDRGKGQGQGQGQGQGPPRPIRGSIAHCVLRIA